MRRFARHLGSRAAGAMLAAVVVTSCGAPGSPTPAPSTAVPLPSGSPSAPVTIAANAYGSFSFSGWLAATDVGPVQPLPFTTLTGAVPEVTPAAAPGGALVTGSAAGTQCFHASSRADIDQYEVLLVFVVRGQRYLLTLAEGFERPGQFLGEATAPAGGRLSTNGGNADQVHLDPEAVALGADPMFLGSYSDGTVVLARDLRSGSVDLTLAAQTGTAQVHVSGRFVCP